MLRKILHLFKKTINVLNRFLELKKVLKHQGELYIGGRTSLNKNTILGKNPNFNGMHILGFGQGSHLTQVYALTSVLEIVGFAGRTTRSLTSMHRLSDKVC